MLPNTDAELFGKGVVLAPGHGADDSGNWDRPVLHGLREDIHTNEIVIDFLQRYLTNAGIRVFSVRERSYQENEVIIDNGDAGYTESGSWRNSSSSTPGRMYGTSYRIADVTDSPPHSTATWTPDIPEAGHYPVYIYLARISSRNRTATYTINHAGGSSTVEVDQRKYGDQFVYLGTWYFNQGTNPATGSVSVSSEGSGSFVHADAVRFGGGVDPDNRYSRWKSDALQFLPYLGYPNEDNDGNVGIRPDYASWIVGDSWTEDWRYLSIHTNAGGGSGASAFVYNNGRPPAWGSTGSPTYSASQEAANDAFSTLVLRQFMTDMRGVENWPTNTASVNGAPVWNIDGSPFPNWGGFTESLLLNFGTLRTNTSMPHALIELAFHDNADDALLLRQEEWRHDAARSLYKAIAKSFDPNVTIVPLPPSGLWVTTDPDAGQFTIGWSPQLDPMETGSDATGYKLYQSLDGLSWDNGTRIGNQSQITLQGSPGQVRFYKIAALNAGGESLTSKAVSARIPQTTGDATVLLVDGFDRQFLYQVDDLTGNEDPTNTLQRYSDNGLTIPALALDNHSERDLSIDSASNEAILSGTIDLKEYPLVIWILGEESTADESFSASEQQLVEDYFNNLDTPGRDKALLVSGAEVAWDLDRISGPLNADRQFYNLFLKSDFVEDDAGSYAVVGEPLSPFSDLSLSFPDGSSGIPGEYDVNFPDVIAPSSGGVGVLRYADGDHTTGNQFAGILFDNQNDARVLTLGFPIETVRLPQAIPFMEAAVDILLEEATATSGPSILGFTPAGATSGETIRLSGSNLSGTTAVFFGQTRVDSFQVLSDQEIEVLLPQNAGSGFIRVVTPEGEALSGSAFSVLLPPSFFEFFPQWGPEGTTVRIEGRNLDGVTGVLFGEIQSDTVTLLSPDTLTALVPTGAGDGPIRLQHPLGDATSFESFEVRDASPGLTSFSETVEGIAGIAIPDDDPTGVVAIAGVTAGGVVETLLISLDISHTFIGDLLVELSAPSGNTVVLHNLEGGGDEDIFLISAPITGFERESISGDWTLFISDNAFFDTGFLNSWSLEIEGSSGNALELVASDGAAPGSVLLSWDPLPGAGNYRIYRSTVNDPNGATQIGSTSQTSFTDESATAGLLYYYWVRGENPLGISSFSESDSGFPQNNSPVIQEGSSIAVILTPNRALTGDDLILNAVDPENQTLVWSIASFPFNGQAVAFGTGTSLSMEYTPDPDFIGIDQFIVEARDPAGAFDRILVEVTVEGAANLPPDSLLLSNNTIEEGLPRGSLVGTFSATDPDGGSTFSFELTDGSGDSDNPWFSISENQLLIKNSLNREIRETYSIRVSATDPGGSSLEQTFSISALSSVLFEEDFENGTAPGWSFEAIGDRDPWSVFNAGDNSSYSIVTLAREDRSDSSAVTPAIMIPANVPGLMLSFRHRYDLEDNQLTSDRAYDAGVLEITFDAGSTWEDIEVYSGGFVAGGYDYSVIDSSSMVLAGDRRAWSDFSDWNEVRVLLPKETVAGTTLQFRWRFASDGATASDGWLLDNVELRSLAADEFTTSDGLFFSEYVEPGSAAFRNRVIEIYNGTGRSIDLGEEGYSLSVHYFVGTERGGDFPHALEGVVQNGDVFVVTRDDADDPTVLAEKNQGLNASTFTFNGDDTVLLTKNGMVVDAVGQLDADPGDAWGFNTETSQNNTLRRLSDVRTGDPVETDAFDPATEWKGFGESNFSGIGWHNFTPSFESVPPTEAGVGISYQHTVLTSDDNASDTLQVTAPTLPGWLTLTDEGNGVAKLAGMPAPEDVGNHPLVLQVTDSRGAFIQQSSTLTVAAATGGDPGIPENALPVLSTLLLTVLEGDVEPFSLPLFDNAFTDSDGLDNLQTVEIQSLPNHGQLTLNGVLITGPSLISRSEIPNVAYTPDPGFSGSDSFDWNASDGKAFAVASAEVRITVIDLNAAPQLSPLVINVFEDSAYDFSSGDFESSFSDPDGDALVQVQIASLPQFGSLTLSGNPVSLNQVLTRSELDQLSYIPDPDYSGSDRFLWNAADGIEYATLSTQALLTAFPVNDPPVVVENPPPVENPSVGTPFSLRVADTHFQDDEGGENLTFEARRENGADLPPWLNFNPGTGELSGTPSTREGGIYNLVVLAEDSNGQQVSTPLSITVPVKPGDWAREKEDEAGLPPGTLSANLEKDRDGDGIPEILEFALGAGQVDGMDPNTLDADKMPAVEMEDGQFKIKYQRNVALEGLSYFKVQVSEDLITWYDVDDPDAPTGFNEAKTGMTADQVESWEASIPTQSAGQVFFRIVVRFEP